MTGVQTQGKRGGSTRRIHVNVRGMSCAGCVAGVEKHLGKVAGVDTVSVSLALESATVTTTSPDLTVADIIGGLEGTTYTATAVDQVDDQSADDSLTLRMFIFGAVLTAPLLITMIAGWFGFDSKLPPWFQFALALPVQVVLGARFYRGAWLALRERTATMDSLVAMGTTAAFVFSTYALTQPERSLDLFFEASAVILTLVMLGKWLEVRARRAASDAIAKLMDLRPETAVLITADGERDVPVESVRPGDRVLVRPGARLPVDGVVSDGVAEIDESMVTGESIPQRRSVGDAVIAGSVSADGRLVVQATRVGADSTLERIVELVRNAQTGKAPVQKLVDSISAVFVPVVILIAAITFSGWIFTGGGIESAVMAAVSVMVIACPCALGLATPTALVAGSGAAAEAGILVRDIETLERAANISHVVFDKTGTLTEGRLAVGYYRTLENDDRALRHRLAVLQQSSEHPLARAIVDFATGPDVDRQLDGLDDFKNEPGEGVSGRVDGVRIACGNELLMQRRGVDVEPISHLLNDSELDGQSVSIIAEEGEVKGVIGFVDHVRESSADAVKRLSASGVLSVLLSGDAPGPVKRISEMLGIANSHSRVLPGKKLAHVEELKSAGHTVAMVGDGVNDAPALAAAHVGIAMGGGTDVALETAGVTLMRPDPGLVSAVIDIARRVRSGIRQNLFWAFIFNLIGVPLAVFGMCSPTVAGAAMAASSVLVVSNSLRLRHWKPELMETRA